LMPVSHAVVHMIAEIAGFGRGGTDGDRRLVPVERPFTFMPRPSPRSPPCLKADDDAVVIHGPLCRWSIQCSPQTIDSLSNTCRECHDGRDRRLGTGFFDRLTGRCSHRKSLSSNIIDSIISVHFSVVPCKTCYADAEAPSSAGHGGYQAPRRHEEMSVVK